MKKLTSFTKEQLYDLYIVQELSTRDVAKQLGIGQTSVRRLLEKYDIKTRTSEQGKETSVYKQKQEVLAKKYQKMYTKEHILICEWCQKEFTVYGADKKKNRFCSKECLSKSKKKPITITSCVYCGENIIQDKTYTVKCCSKCQKMHPWARLQSNRIITNCGYCGKEIEVIPSRYNSNIKCYCDMECMAKDYSERFSGENSPSWKGGKSHHYTGDFWGQRKLAIERDDHTCQLCGITEADYGQQLSVHHIINYREFDDKYEANKLDNLISLCEPCHRFIHSNSNVFNMYIKYKDDKQDIV